MNLGLDNDGEGVDDKGVVMMGLGVTARTYVTTRMCS